jgi:predicted transcriptional regulator of viral defense system
MVLPSAKRKRVLQLLRETGVLRPRDLKKIGVSGVYLNKLYAEGVLERLGRGLYTLASFAPSEHRTLVEACQRVPSGIVCLLSALRFYGLTTEAPFEVWLAIGGKARKPQSDYPPLRIVHFSGQALTFGIDEHEVEGVPVRIYSPAKTVADCFKFRSKIGLDVAIEALRDCLAERQASVDELWTAAKVCRMSEVMRPYLEAMT